MSTASLTELPQKKISRKLQTLRKKRTPHGKISPPIDWCPTDTDGLPNVAWSDWQAHLIGRTVPVEISELYPTGKKTSVLLWGVDDGLVESSAMDSINTLYRACRTKLSRKSTDMRIADQASKFVSWPSASKSREPDIELALVSLALAQAMPRLATSLDPDDWWRLLGGLVNISVDSRALSLDEQPLSHQLLAGELALTLHFSFPEIRFQKPLWQQAREQLNRGLNDLLDGEGLPHAKHLALLRPLLACWSRVCSMEEALGKQALQRDARTQYEWCVRQAIRLTRHDGTQSLNGRTSGSWCPELFDLALDHSDDPNDDEAARISLPGARPTQRAGRFTDLPEPQVHSEWAEVSSLRISWKPKSARLSIAHTNRTIYGELEVSGRLLWSGLWEPLVTADGRPVRVADDWEVVCWFTDDDGDYLELEAECDNGYVIQRQIYLAREDKFLYAADAISGTKSCDLEYECRLHLGADISYAPDSETAEGFLVNDRGRPLAHCLPLGLPEWRSDRPVGQLAEAEGCLQLRQRAQAQRLYAPLWFDLDVNRMGKPITWRQLTVAEQLQKLSPEQAVGYRIQVGKKQWLIYRSLAARANRTVLGQNLSSDCLIARFRRDGTTESLVEIE